MLLDTHVLLWLLTDEPALGEKTRAVISDATAVHVSAASIWEIAIKAELGKLEVPDDLPRRIERAGLQHLPVTPAHAWAMRAVSGLPHRDPFDRLLVAQAGVERLRFLTADRAVLEADLAPQVAVLDARS